MNEADVTAILVKIAGGTTGLGAMVYALIRMFRSDRIAASREQAKADSSNAVDAANKAIFDMMKDHGALQALQIAHLQEDLRTLSNTVIELRLEVGRLSMYEKEATMLRELLEQRDVLLDNLAKKMHSAAAELEAYRASCVCGVGDPDDGAA